MRSTTTPASRADDTGNGALVDADWLTEHIDDPALRLIEVDVSRVAFDEGHIKGARLWNVYRDLKNADYELVDRWAIEALLAACAITADSIVVFYGYAPAMGFWLMKLYRHVDVRILNCSRDTWHDDGRPWTTATETESETGTGTGTTELYRLADQDERIRADFQFVRDAIDDPTSTIVDVRSPAEFARRALLAFGRCRGRRPRRARSDGRAQPRRRSARCEGPVPKPSRTSRTIPDCRPVRRWRR